jgi:hypothetical protein
MYEAPILKIHGFLQRKEAKPHPHHGRSGAKQRPTPARTPETQQREATTKVLSSEQRALKDLTTPTSDTDSGLKNGALRGSSVEKMQGSNPDGLKRRLNGVGSIARGFTNGGTIYLILNNYY